MIKRIILFILSVLPLITLASEGTPYDFMKDDTFSITTQATTDTAKLAKDEILDHGDSLLSKLIDAFNLSPYKTSDSAISYVKVVINYFLALLSFVTLALMIYAFYRMLWSADSDDAYKKAKKLMTTMAVALAVIAFSWFIISWFFSIFFNVRG